MKQLAVPMCTCHTKNPKTTTKLKKVKADEEGICKKCGHYVVWVSKYQLYPKAHSIGGYTPVVGRWAKGFSCAQSRAYQDGNIYATDPYGDSLDIDYKALVNEE